MDHDDVRALLGEIEDPELGGDIVSLGLINELTVEGELASIDLALGAPYSPTETNMAGEIRDVLEAEGLEVDLSASVPDRDDLPSDEQVLPNVKNVIAVASGKGGVGKSTVAVNIAAGLSKLGASVGLFDADIYGPNVPRMVDADEPPMATEQETLVPPEKYGVKLMSMGFLAGEEDPVIWRGPMVHKIITQLTEDVEWGHLDYLVVDLPPGTGDTQLTMLQTMPVTGAVIVTTPQDVALDDARKGLEMFAQHETVVLGIVENMATFVCTDCDSEHDIFGAGGGSEFADAHEMPFLGSIPLDPTVRAGGDAGEPTVLNDGDGTADAFRTVVENVANNTGIVHRRRVSQARRVRADAGE